MKKKGMLIAIGALFVLCLGCGIVGISYEKKEVPEVPQVPKELITYIYFLDGVESSDMPVNGTVVDENGIETPDIKYVFEKLDCNNKITGDFNENTWQFTPSPTSKDIEGVCKLYFGKAKYEVSFTVVEGKEDENNPKTVDRAKDGVFKITPNDGYEFDQENSMCSDDKSFKWEETDNTLTISAVMKEVSCKIVFKIKTLKLDITAENGEGTTTLKVEYGEKAESIVSPKSGYEYSSVKCTNDQSAEFKDNKIYISKLTKDSTCTVKFSAIKVTQYKLKISNLPDNLKISVGELEQLVNSGAAGSFTVKPDTGYAIDGYDCGRSIQPSIEENADGSKKYTFLAMANDITCSFTQKAN